MAGQLLFLGRARERERRPEVGRRDERQPERTSFSRVSFPQAFLFARAAVVLPHGTNECRPPDRGEAASPPCGDSTDTRCCIRHKTRQHGKTQDNAARHKTRQHSKAQNITQQDTREGNTARHKTRQHSRHSTTQHSIVQRNATHHTELRAMETQGTDGESRPSRALVSAMHRTLLRISRNELRAALFGFPSTLSADTNCRRRSCDASISDRLGQKSGQNTGFKSSTNSDGRRGKAWGV